MTIWGGVKAPEERVQEQAQKASSMRRWVTPVPITTLHRTIDEYIMISINVCEYPVLVLQPAVACGRGGAERTGHRHPIIHPQALPYHGQHIFRPVFNMLELV